METEVFGMPSSRNPSSTRRRFLAILGSAACAGCVSTHATGLPSADLVIGKRGLADGRFQKPRAMAISPADEIFVIDKTARVQVFDLSGNFLRGWKTPQSANGKPTGASIDPSNGNLLVADTHYFQFLTYTPTGELLADRTIGGVNGPEPGQFGWVTDIARAPDGTLYLAEYGEFDRIYKYSADGQYIDRFGEHGDAPMQFSRPQTLAVDDEGLLWIADSCNHRIQVVDWREATPRSVAVLGSQGAEIGQLQFPYGMKLISKNRLLVSEFGNHRVQCWSRDGTPIASWGSAGELAGQLNQPWAVDVDSNERVYVVDSGNNRIQRFLLS
jgi:DNA-binding beta-propeller fold protein YncE